MEMNPQKTTVRLLKEMGADEKWIVMYELENLARCAASFPPLFAWLENEGVRDRFCSLSSLSQWLCHTIKYFVITRAYDNIYI